MAGTCSQILMHIVFGTHFRRLLISSEIRDDLYRYIQGVLDREGAVGLAIGGMPDHIHVLASLRPVHSVAEIVKKIKGASSRWVNQQEVLGETFAWQDGYGGFSVSPSQLERVRRYILNQEQHHRSRTFEQEWDDLVQLHRLPDGVSRDTL